jgi:formyltetrahydrofolate deformylase
MSVAGPGVRAYAVLPGHARSRVRGVQFLVQHSAKILASRQYGESPDGRFFMRVHFSVPAQDAELAQDLQLARLERGFSWVAEAFHISRQLHHKAARVRTPIVVSRLGCPASDPLTRNPKTKVRT